MKKFAALLLALAMLLSLSACHSHNEDVSVPVAFDYDSFTITYSTSCSECGKDMGESVRSIDSAVSDGYFAVSPADMLFMLQNMDGYTAELIGAAQGTVNMEIAPEVMDFDEDGMVWSISLRAPEDELSIVNIVFLNGDDYVNEGEEGSAQYDRIMVAGFSELGEAVLRNVLDMISLTALSSGDEAMNIMDKIMDAGGYYEDGGLIYETRDDGQLMGIIIEVDK